MGVEVVKLYCMNLTDIFTTEPLKEHLTDISELVVKRKS
jgi:hypothetical protein